MRYRALGNTGLRVSEVSFGTIPVLSGPSPVLPDAFDLDDAAAVAVMRRAYHYGCNLFDTAIVPEYGDAERKLGLFAAEVGRENLIISDKARYYHGGEMYLAVKRSIHMLGCRPDIYFVHQVDEESADTVFGRYGAIDALCDLKAEGCIRFVGVASHYYDLLLRAARDNRVDVLQGSGNILERGMLERMESEPLFAEKGFLLNKVYAAGILPRFFTVQELLAGALSYPVSSALIGLGLPEQVDAVMAREPKRLPRPAFSQVIAALERSFHPIACDRCQRCRCPYGTEIHTLLRQYNYYFLGKDYWALRKLDMSIRESAAQCERCADMPCERQCPQGIRIHAEIGRIRCLVERHIRKGIV